MKKLTIIISTIGDGDEIFKTIKSIQSNTAKGEYDIIIFDDNYNGCDFTELSKNEGIRIVSNGFANPDGSLKKDKNGDILKGRRGAPFSWNKGISMSQTPFVMICNPRMRFTKGWYERVIQELEKDNKCIYCTTCVVLDDKIKSIGKSKQKRYGADLYYIYDDHYGRQILHPVWAKAKKEKVYKIGCNLGGVIISSKKWLEHLKGFEGCYTWGGLNAFISLKSYMAGGSCKLIKDVETGNIFRTKPSYPTMEIDKLYNQMFTAYTLLPPQNAIELLYNLRKKRPYEILVNTIIVRMKEIKYYKNYFKSIKKHEAIKFIKEE